MHGEMNYLQPVRTFAETSWVEDNKKWIQLYPYDSWDHPVYGTTTVDKEIAQKFVENFDKGVRGHEIHTDYEHGKDPAKGTKASGKYVKLETRDEGLFGLVEFTDTAKEEIEKGEWNYWSTSHFDSWKHPQTGEEFEFVIEGGGLTNKPYVKGMVPLNFSELLVENPDLRMHSVWSTSFVNNLPDSSFLYIEPGGKKDAEGKTVPRSLRHLPYKDAKGNVDLAHLRNAIARIPQTSSVNADLAKTLQAKARNLLKNHTELLDPEEVVEMLELPELEVEAEIEPEPIHEEGGETVDFEKELRTLLGLDENADLLAHVKGMNDELTPLRDLAKEHAEKKQFAELYPEQAARLEKLEKESQDSFAKEFSETFTTARVIRKTGEGDDLKTETTGLGFSALTIEKIRECAKEFSEGKPNFDSFKSVLDNILDNGIVDYGTRGSSTELPEEEDPKPSKTPAGARKQFSEIIEKIVEEDKVDFNTAYGLAAQKHPELFKAYKEQKPIAVGA
jgi:hypothetical protein